MSRPIEWSPENGAAVCLVEEYNYPMAIRCYKCNVLFDITGLPYTVDAFIEKHDSITSGMEGNQCRIKDLGGDWKKGLFSNFFFKTELSDTEEKITCTNCAWSRNVLKNSYYTRGMIKYAHDNESPACIIKNTEEMKTSDSWQYGNSCDVNFMQMETPFKKFTNKSVICSSCMTIIVGRDEHPTFGGFVNSHFINNPHCKDMDFLKNLSIDSRRIVVIANLDDFPDYNSDTSSSEGESSVGDEITYYNADEFTEMFGDDSDDDSDDEGIEDLSAYDEAMSVNDVDYKDVKERECSFSTWPKQMKQDSKEMAEAGWYYTGKSDRVRCFHCGITFGGWMPDDDPWSIHKLMEKETCGWLELNPDKIPKVLRYIDDEGGEDKEEDGGGGGGVIEFPKNNKEVENPKRGSCKACYERKADIAFIPCGHVFSCNICTMEMFASYKKKKRCPMCRVHVEKVQKIFLDEDEDMA